MDKDSQNKSILFLACIGLVFLLVLFADVIFTPQTSPAHHGMENSKTPRVRHLSTTECELPYQVEQFDRITFGYPLGAEVEVFDNRVNVTIRREKGTLYWAISREGKTEDTGEAFLHHINAPAIFYEEREELKKERGLRINESDVLYRMGTGDAYMRGFTYYTVEYYLKGETYYFICDGYLYKAVAAAHLNKQGISFSKELYVLKSTINFPV